MFCESFMVLEIFKRFFVDVGISNDMAAHQNYVRGAGNLY